MGLIDSLDSIAKRREACKYRVATSCASCINCERTFHGVCHAEQMFSARCKLHDFDVHLDRGICNDFDNVGKYRG